MFHVNGGPNQRNKMFLNTGHCTAIKLKNHSIKLKLVSIITWINWTFQKIVISVFIYGIVVFARQPKTLSRPPVVSSSHLTQKCRPRTVPIVLILCEPPPPRSPLILIATQVVYFRVRTRELYYISFYLFHRSIMLRPYEERPLHRFRNKQAFSTEHT